MDTTIKINKIPKDLKNQFYYKEFLEHKKTVKKKSKSEIIIIFYNNNNYNCKIFK